MSRVQPTSSFPVFRCVVLGMVLGMIGADLARDWLPWSSRYEPALPLSLIEMGQADRAKGIHKPTVVKLGPEDRRRLFRDLCDSEARAQRAADACLPIRSVCPSDRRAIRAVEEEYVRLIVESRAESRARLSRQYGLEPERFPDVVAEGLREGWDRDEDGDVRDEQEN